MQPKKCMRFIVSGRVQGVWFRASTQEEANELGLTGWAANLPDGTVEVIACGEQDKLAQLHEWLKEGPELAKVDNVQYEALPWKDYGRFGVK